MRENRTHGSEGGEDESPSLPLSHADDRRITNRVMADMLAKQQVRQFKLLVVTVRGEVLLSGLVDRQTQIDSAVKVARWVNGVRDVRHVMNLRK